MTNSRKCSLVSILVILALAFALFFTMAVLPVRISATAEGAEPGEHMHDEITFTAWTSTTSLPSSAQMPFCPFPLRQQEPLPIPAAFRCISTSAEQTQRFFRFR